MQDKPKDTQIRAEIADQKLVMFRSDELPEAHRMLLRVLERGKENSKNAKHKTGVFLMCHNLLFFGFLLWVNTAGGFQASAQPTPTLPNARIAEPARPASTQPPKPGTTQPASPGSTQPVNSGGAGVASAKPAEHRSIEGTVESVAKDGSELRLKISIENGQEKVQVIHVPDQSLKDKLKSAQNQQAGGTPCTSPICSCICPGDKVIAKVGVETKANVQAMALEDISPQMIAVSAWEPWTAMLVTAAILLAITFVLSRNIRGLLLIGEDGRYSNSKAQISLWFGVVIVTYISAFFMRWQHAGLIGHLSIPANLLVLSGLSGLTYAGAKGITTAKHAADVAKGNPGKTEGNPSFPGDFIKSDDGHFDLGDYQMIVITMIAVISYLWIATNFLANLPQCSSATLPDVDGTVLAMFGVGQGAYLTKKAATDVNH